MPAQMDPFMTALGFQGEVPAPGEARVWVRLAPEHLNSWGSAHGGLLFTLADSAFALASNAHGPLAVALGAHIAFLRATRVGDTLEACAREVSLTRRTGVYQVEIRCGGDLVAVFTGTAHRKVHPGA